MDIQLTGGIMGVACLAFAAIGTFLLVPDRELTIRERIGIHTIFWCFTVYAMWIIYLLMGTDAGWDKYFMLGFPLLLGLMLSLLSELNSRQPPFNVTAPRLKKITLATWARLPNSVKRGLQKTIMNVQSIEEWSTLDREVFQPKAVNAARWFPILPYPARGIIHVSIQDCANLPDPVITANLAQQFALAYQTTKTPFDAEVISRAEGELPLKWGFKKEMAALADQRTKTN